MVTWKYKPFISIIVTIKAKFWVMIASGSGQPLSQYTDRLCTTDSLLYMGQVLSSVALFKSSQENCALPKISMFCSNPSSYQLGVRIPHWLLVRLPILGSHYRIPRMPSSRLFGPIINLAQSQPAGGRDIKGTSDRKGEVDKVRKGELYKSLG